MAGRRRRTYVGPIPAGIPPGLQHFKTLDDDYVRCPGSDAVHPLIFLPVLKGTRNLYCKCGVVKCASHLNLAGFGWREKYEKEGKIGFTREEIKARFPNALIL